MKKTIITIMLAIVSMATFAQNEPGTLTIYPRVGVNFSKFADSGIGYFDGQSIAYTESEFKAGLVLGVEGEYQLSDLFAINGGALYSRLQNAHRTFRQMRHPTRVRHRQA